VWKSAGYGENTGGAAISKSALNTHPARGYRRGHALIMPSQAGMDREKDRSCHQAVQAG
jgi:hypothetical protein